jgi:hypothetical protein
LSLPIADYFWNPFMTSGRHCPYCNSTAVTGLGAFVKASHTGVELRCRDCGNLFIGEDRRNTAEAEPVENISIDFRKKV